MPPAFGTAQEGKETTSTRSIIQSVLRRSLTFEVQGIVSLKMSNSSWNAKKTDSAVTEMKLQVQLQPQSHEEGCANVHISLLRYVGDEVPPNVAVVASKLTVCS
jgi:hypothetical protein